MLQWNRALLKLAISMVGMYFFARHQDALASLGVVPEYIIAAAIGFGFASLGVSALKDAMQSGMLDG